MQNRTYLAAKLFACTYLGFTLYLSFSHQIALFAGLGSHTPWVAPLITDSLMVFGKMIRSPKLTAGTRRIGVALQLAGAAASLTGNILAGDNAGDRILGAMVITFMLVVEFVTDHTKPVEQDAAAAKKAKTAATAAKAQATRAANKAADAVKAEQDKARKERDALMRRIKASEKAAAKQTAELAEWAADTTAPVSPAPAGSNAWTYV